MYQISNLVILLRLVLEQRSFLKKGDQLMYYDACMMGLFMPKPSGLCVLISSGTVDTYLCDVFIA